MDLAKILWYMQWHACHDLSLWYHLHLSMYFVIFLTYSFFKGRWSVHVATPCDRLILWREISFLVQSTHHTRSRRRHTFIHSPPHATAQRRRYHLIVSFPHKSLNSSRATPRNTSNIPSSLSEGTQRNKEVLGITLYSSIHTHHHSHERPCGTTESCDFSFGR